MEVQSVQEKANRIKRRRKRICQAPNNILIFLTLISMLWMQSGINTFIVTISEKVTITNPYFLLRIVHDQTNQEFSCIVPDSSTETERYNRLQVTQMTSPDNTDAEINVTESGLFHYYIYEQTSSTNLDYTATQGLLEVGKLTYPLPSVSTTTYTGYPTTSTVYQG